MPASEKPQKAIKIRIRIGFWIPIGDIIFNRIAVSAYRKTIINHTENPMKESMIAAIEVNKPPMIPGGELPHIW